MKTIEIIIRPDGGTEIDGKGFSGPECEKATAAFEEALGSVSKKVKKPEFYRQAQASQKAGAS